VVTIPRHPGSGIQRDARTTARQASINSRTAVRLQLEESQEFADLVALLSGVAHGGVGVDAVTVSAAYSFALDVAGFDQVGDDALSRSLGDSDPVGDVTESRVRVALDAEKNLGVVREEPPGLPGAFQA
jgi:hypothetical protein